MSALRLLRRQPAAPAVAALLVLGLALLVVGSAVGVRAVTAVGGLVLAVVVWTGGGLLLAAGRRPRPRLAHSCACCSAAGVQAQGGESAGESSGPAAGVRTEGVAS